MRLDILPYVIISSLGLGLNTIIGSIIIFGLKVSSSELIVALLISIIDSIFYINNIVHAIYTTNKPIVNGIYTLIPVWFTRLNLVIIASTLLSSIGLVTILSVMRYVKICLCKKISDWVWIFSSLFLIFLFFGLSSINVLFYVFICPATNYFCGPNVQMDTQDGTPNLMFLKINFILYLIVVILPLPIITFCYIKVASTYYKVAHPQYLNNLAVKRRLEISHSPCPSNQFPILYDGEKKLDKQIIKKKRVSTTIKISLVILAYLICFISEFVLTLFVFSEDVISIHVNVILQCLICCSGLVSAFFVLLVNVQVQDILKRLFKYFYMLFVQDGKD